MRPPLALVVLFALIAGLGTFATAYTRPKPAAPAAVPATPPVGEPRVRLAVLVVFDQMRGDYPERWKAQFGPGGFARLQADGAWFTRCYYPYATTTTGPGHASILSGTCMDRHGIVNNTWHANGRSVYCATDDRYAPAAYRGTKPPAGGSPTQMLSKTVADVLRETYRKQAKVFGLSLKDRSAILPTGKSPDGAFWFDGRFTTSTYYTERLDHRVPGWVTAFNNAGVANRWFGRDWTRFRPDLDYAALSGPDDGPGEGGGVAQGRTFPHPTTGGEAKPGSKYASALACSPYGNELLLEFAKTCVVAEGLGRDDVPDLLVVSFSSNDLIGHTWGPDSQEVLDVTLRSDALLADLLRFLDQRVGDGKYVLAVTADHGSCPLPEASAARGRGAKRVDLTPVQVGAEQHLQARFGKANVVPRGKSGWIEAFAFPWVHLNPALLRATGRARAEVARELADYLAAQPDVFRTYTREDITGREPRDEIDQRVRRAYYPARCGDVYVILNPYDLPSKPGGSGTTHGSPHGYDAHVPLLVYGPDIVGGEPRTEPVTPQATAAIFSRFLGIRPPPDADFPVPATLEDQ